MKLQLALDLLDVAMVRKVVDDVVDLVDIVEIGTPLILQEGMRIVTEIKERHPTVTLLADLKIMDAGEFEAEIGFDAGADIVTVLGAAHDSTIQGALNQARKRGKQLMVDLISVKDVQTRTGELELLGVDFVCVHTAFDVQRQGQSPLREMQLVETVRKCTKIAVAGGITPATLPEILVHQPDVVIVGGFVTGHSDKRKAVKEIRQVLGSAK